ncbi:MAG: NTP transferase domain-containing protein [Chloroflexi bacterium]|nr:NTP transferase domain-containing protein [Chloroflexota bacterium]
MTVAAVILSATAEGALTDTLGQPRVRRLVDIAWSGGALPIVVVAPDDGGAVARALVGSEAVYGAPAALDGGPAGQMAHGVELALAEVRETSGFLVWPARMTWVGPETVTSLIEAHGVSPGEILRPGWNGTAGWPVLVPTASMGALRGVPADRMPPEVVDTLAATVPSRVVEVGDPGVVHDAETAYADLPPYDGPPDPPAGHTHEWGDRYEEEGVDEGVPGEGRGLAPFPQAADDEAVDLG